MTPTYRTIFMGSDSFSLPVLSALIAGSPSLSTPLETVAVVTQPDRPVGRGRRLQAGPVKLRAHEAYLPVLQPESLRDPQALEGILSLHPDLIVVAAYGQILPRALLMAPPKGCLNLHPSLLPRFRGATPVAGAILAGDSLTGTTLMEVIPRMDAGPIVAQEQLAIEPYETTGELEARLANLSGTLLLRELSAWLDGTAAGTPQDEAAATYTSRLQKADGRVDWTRSATEISRQVRAFNPWPAAHTNWEDRLLRLWRARPGSGTGRPGLVLGLKAGALEVACGEGSLLVGEAQLAGGRRLPATDLTRGHPALLSANLR